MNLLIRKMTLNDIPFVVQLDKLSFSLPWPERSFRFELTDNPASRCWVAVAYHQIVGMIVAWMLADEVHIATIATHPEFRRQRIASRLLTYSLLRAREEGARSSFLEVRESNLAAQELYRKFGYEVTGRRKRYYRDNDEDAILMSLGSLSNSPLVNDGGTTAGKEQK
jgi:ribosomal-protein-alanine N-acetyltransferase